MVNHGVHVVFAEVSAVCGFGTPLGRLLKLLWFPHKAYCASSVPSASAAARVLGQGCRACCASLTGHQPAKFSCESFFVVIILRRESHWLSVAGLKLRVSLSLAK